MPERTLRDCRILVVEDEYMLAYELRTELEVAGAAVLGPAATFDDALELIGSVPEIDGAILDGNLGGESVYPAADLLIERGVPLVLSVRARRSGRSAHMDEWQVSGIGRARVNDRLWVGISI